MIVKLIVEWRIRMDIIRLTSKNRDDFGVFVKV